MQNFLRILMILPILLVVTGCATNPVTGRSEIMLVSESQEVSIGLKAAPSLLWSYGGEYHDPELKQYLEPIVRRLWAASERPHLPLKFVIQNHSVPNAFALPGYVAITRALLVELENEAQFAAVMGHEVGHVMARHTAKRISMTQLQSVGLQVSEVFLQNSKYGDLALQAGALGSGLMLLSYDRTQEMQSDGLGIKYMAALGYDPKEAIGAHVSLQRSVDNYMARMGSRRTKGTLLDNMLSTHPRHEVRVEEMNQMLAGYPPFPPAQDGAFKERFDKALKGIVDTAPAYHAYDRAEKLFKEEKLKEAKDAIEQAIAISDTQSPFYTLAGMINIMEEDPIAAQQQFSRALELDTNYQPAVYGLGVAMHNRQNFKGALAEFKRSISLYSEHIGSFYGAGSSAFELDDCSETLKYLIPFAQAAPSHPRVHGMLGGCYEQSGNTQTAVAHYQAQLRINSKNDMAIHARSRLRVITGR